MIRIDETKCVGCNACIRACPVNEANVAHTIDERNIISINDSNCIHCGNCIKACTHGARYFEDDTEEFFSDLKNRKITILVTPAIKVAFHKDWGAVLEWLRKQPNVAGIYDVSFGADICTYMHLKAVKEGRVRKIISQPCAALTDYILKYQHDLLPYLSPIHSPILCAAIYLRKYCNIDHPLAVLSPCAAKKTEFIDTGIVSYNVIFSALREHMKKNNVNLYENASFVFDGVPSLSGAIYPMPGGLKECLLAMNPELNVINSEGVPKVYHALDDYLKIPDSIKPDVFDVLSCEHGCVSGPGVPEHVHYFQMMHTMNKIKAEAFERQGKQKNFLRRSKQYKSFDSALRLEDFVRKYQPKNLNLELVLHEQLNDAFLRLYKKTETERRVNCGACGYSTCTDMAMAVARGLNDPVNCYQYVLNYSRQEEEEIHQKAEKTLAVQQKINGLADDLMREVDALHRYSDTILDHARENEAALDSLQKVISDFRNLNDVIISNIEQIGEINQQYVSNSKIVDDIAQQIRLVSLNASIEAARAGNAGREFAMVATEVRSLAQKTQGVTKDFHTSSMQVTEKTDDITQDIRGIEEELQELTKMMGTFKEVFTATSELGSEIYGLSEEVRTVTNQIQDVINE